MHQRGSKKRRKRFAIYEVMNRILKLSISKRSSSNVVVREILRTMDAKNSGYLVMNHQESEGFGVNRWKNRTILNEELNTLLTMNGVLCVEQVRGRASSFVVIKRGNKLVCLLFDMSLGRSRIFLYPNNRDDY